MSPLDAFNASEQAFIGGLFGGFILYHVFDASGLWLLTHVTAAVNWLLSLGAGPFFGSTPKELRRLREEAHRPFMRQTGR